MSSINAEQSTLDETIGCVSDIHFPTIGSSMLGNLKVNRVSSHCGAKFRNVSDCLLRSTIECCRNDGGQLKHGRRVAHGKWRWEEEVGGWCSTSHARKEKPVHLNRMVRPRCISV